MNEPITMCAKHFPAVDRYGTPIRVGDRLRVQHCIGRYGQTEIVEITVTEEHYPYGQINFPGGLAAFQYDHENQIMLGYDAFNDFEHGHETWVEII